MIPEIWEQEMTVVFVGVAVTEPSETLGFYHLHPRDRFWEMLELGGITPQRVITPQERKALAEGHSQGSLSDPVRLMFIEKKTSQLVRGGIGLTDINRRVVAGNEKDQLARPTEEDIQQFIGKVEKLKPGILGFVTRPELFVELFQRRYQDASDTFGPQPFTIAQAKVWLLGSTSGLLRGEALRKQEDTFFALGEHISALKAEA